MRSYGITPQDFVKKCWYVQEGVILDFWPTDEKYKEMLIELNLQLEILQMENYSWQRKHVTLGPCMSFDATLEIPEFEIPPEFYMPAMGHKDSILLRHPRNPVPLQVKWASQSSINSGPAFSVLGDCGYTQVDDTHLKATYTEQGIITFNRPLNRYEQQCTAETDMILRLPQVHICDETCPNAGDVNFDDTVHDPTPCPHIEKRILEFMPDPNYLIYKVVEAHGAYSPTAQIAAANAGQKAKEIRSQMSENDAQKTTPDIIHRQTQSFNMVV